MRRPEVGHLSFITPPVPEAASDPPASSLRTEIRRERPVTWLLGWDWKRPLVLPPNHLSSFLIWIKSASQEHTWWQAERTLEHRIKHSVTHLGGEQITIQKGLGWHKQTLSKALNSFKILLLRCSCPCVSVELGGPFGEVEGVSVQSVLVEEGAKTVHPWITNCTCSGLARPLGLIG